MLQKGTILIPVEKFKNPNTFLVSLFVLPDDSKCRQIVEGEISPNAFQVRAKRVSIRLELMHDELSYLALRISIPIIIIIAIILFSCIGLKIRFKEKFQNNTPLLDATTTESTQAAGGTYLPHRGTYLPHRGSNLSHRGTYLPHRGSNLSHRGTYLPHSVAYIPPRCTYLPPRGTYLPHRGSLEGACLARPYTRFYPDLTAVNREYSGFVLFFKNLIFIDCNTLGRLFHMKTA